MNRRLYDVLCCILILLNIGVAYAITVPLGIQNQILWQSYTAMNYCITYEIIIWFTLTFIEGLVIEKIEQG